MITFFQFYFPLKSQIDQIISLISRRHYNEEYAQKYEMNCFHRYIDRQTQYKAIFDSKVIF